MQEKLPDQELAKVMAWLAEKMRCPLCGYRYNLERISVVPKNSGKIQDVLVHTNCGQCHCSLLFALDIRGGEVMLVGVVTDLTYKDVIKFRDRPALSVDEVIEWHRFWESFDGDLVKVLN